MGNENQTWTKEELKIYILLLCAKSDDNASEEELALIKSKSDSNTFEKVYSEFDQDCEDDCLEKIQDNLERHDYSGKELQQLRREMHEVFLTDKKFMMMERNMDRILDNILY